MNSKRPRKSKWRRALRALIISSVVSFLLLEFALRFLGGFEPFSWPLKRAVVIREEQQPDEEFLRPFLDTWHTGDDLGISRDWFLSSPELLEKSEILAEHKERWERLGRRSWVNYILNEHALLDWKNRPRLRGLLSVPPIPEFVYLAPGPAGDTTPAYRYPPSVTLPTGLATNAFGHRGPEFNLGKPDACIRIACLGASTTVGGHDLPFSYPELLQHWLNLWCKELVPGIRVEVINGGREAIQPEDSVGILRYEISPFEPDLVVYYEGWNHVMASELLELESTEGGDLPPPGDDRSSREHHLAIAAYWDRLRSRGTLLEEIPHPAQALKIPESFNANDPDPFSQQEVLLWEPVLSAMEDLRTLTDQMGAELLVCTYSVFCHEGLKLDAQTSRSLHRWLNQRCWPMSYASIEQFAAIQNRRVRNWARHRKVPLLDVAGLTPRDPSLFRDGIHASSLGTRVRAWIVFQELIPHLSRLLESGSLPRLDPRAFPPTTHPHLHPWHKAKIPR